MKVGIITSWNIRCGIAEYSRDFLEAIKGKVDPYIIPINVALDFPRFKFIVKEFSNPDALIFMFEHGLTKGFEPFKNWVLKFHSNSTSKTLRFSTSSIGRGRLEEPSYPPRH